MRRPSSRKADSSVLGMMAPSSGIVLALSLLLVACAGPVSENDRPCPCAAGWVCCTARNVCAREIGLCGIVPGDVTPPAAPSLSSSSPASPTNQSRADVLGTAEIGARVDLFIGAGCSGPVAGSGSANAAGQFRISLTLVPDATTQVWARAADGAGNVSACSAQALQIVQDSQAPAAPALVGVSPGPLSNATIRPEISGTGEPGSTVVLFGDDTCGRELPYAGPVDVAGAFHIEARVDPNTITVFSARAIDAAGNESGCSGSTIQFEHDDTPPSAPVLTGTVPPSPSPQPAPVLTGTVEPGATVRLYREKFCAGATLDEQLADGKGSFAFTLNVAHNVATSLFARAHDAAGNVSGCSTALEYVHDDIPPGPLGNASFVPASPAAALDPEVRGFVPAAEPGEKVRLRDWWDGSVLAVADVGSDGFFSARVAARENGFLEVLATPIDAAGNLGPEKEVGIYENDTIAPVAPTVVTTSVPSPSEEISFRVMGTGEVGTQIDLWADPNCASSLSSSSRSWYYDATTSSISYVAFGALPADGTLDVYATSTDAAGNRSPCSTDHVSFVHASSGLRWTYPRGATSYNTGVAMSGDGTAFELTGSGLNAIAVRRALPGEDWRTPEEVAATAPSVALTPAAIVPEADGALLVVWAEDDRGAGQTIVDSVRFRSRAADGTWSAVQLLSTHESWVRDLWLLSDRNGAWLAWLAKSISDPQSEELWIAHHEPGSGWTDRQRISAAGQIVFHGMAGGAAGHAILKWEESTPSPERTLLVAFHDPSSGWGSPEALPDSYGMPVAMDDLGRAMVATVDSGENPVLHTRRHLPDKGWEAPVDHGRQDGILGALEIELNAAGDAVLAWTMVNPAISSSYYPFFVQRYSAAIGWEPPEAKGTVNMFGTSFGDDGSIWILAAGITPHLQTQLNARTEPTWLLRYVPGSGWMRPQMVIDDFCDRQVLFCRAADAQLFRNAAGTALLQWSNVSLSGPYGLMRWFR
jgi:hypothetical protein